MKFLIELRIEDRHFLNLTDLDGATTFTEYGVPNTGLIQIGTDSLRFFEDWCNTLRASDRSFKVISSGHISN